MSWPKLSESLGGPRSPDRCQCCAAFLWGEFDRWREHDDDDRPTPVVVVLCDACSRSLIEPHPRLYSRLDANEHHPGTMELCQLCHHRRGLTCPLAKINGGPGVGIAPAPSRMHVRAARRSQSGAYLLWRPPVSCTHRSVLTIHQEVD